MTRSTKTEHFLNNQQFVDAERHYKRHCFWALVLFLFVIATDQITKYWAVAHLPETTLNRGISWSLFDSDSTMVFCAVSFCIGLFILFFSWYVYRFYRARQSLWGAALVLAGALGNMLDRFVVGGVIDFIALSWGGIAWPVFNVADVAICCGVFYLVVTNE